ncbi:MAG: hypothetical protein IH957_07435 [Chloroflexi bacterium]|nr:hypothetical protein [Chloroflexota bacterium]
MQQETSVNHYQTLQVHPAAPLDLIAAAYWHLVGSGPSQNGDVSVAVVHELSKAYAVLTDAAARDAYDRSIELKPQPLVPKMRKRQRPISRFLPRRRQNGADFKADYYEVIRVHPTAAPKIVDEGYAVMRTVYLRLVTLGEQPVHLLDLLEEAYSVTSDADLRRKYDATRNGKSAPPVTNGADTPTRTQPDPPAGATATSTPMPVTDKTTQTTKAETPAPQTKVVDTERIAIREQIRVPAPIVTKQAWARRLRSVARLARSAFRTAARGTATAARATPAVARSLIAIVFFVPRGVFGLGEFTVGLVTALIVDPALASPPAVRKVFPDEEAALVARISESADAVHSSNRSEPVAGLLARVIVVDGPEKGTTFEVTRWPINVGAAPDCDIVLSGLAPQQLRLLARGDELVLYALSVSPAVRVNGEPVTWSLVDRDTIVIGPHSLRIERISR